MPRRHRRAPEAEPRPISQGVRSLSAPEWAVAGGATVRVVTGQKTYLCPGCMHDVRAGVSHLVVVEQDDVEGRRHWHTECWRRELRRRGVAS
ncbi:MAG TPA: hypothetical protein VGH10_13330 [Actinomycetota bacterium]|jgi:hypothetical protein